LNAALVMLGMVTESVVVVSMAYIGEIVEAHTAWWWDRHREKVYSLAKWLGEERVELCLGGYHLRSHLACGDIGHPNSC